VKIREIMTKASSSRVPPFLPLFSFLHFRTPSLSPLGSDLMEIIIIPLLVRSLVRSFVGPFFLRT